MRFPARFAVLGAFALLPATASAFVWPFNPPAMPEAEAVAIATGYGIAVITDIDGTLDGDWHIEGHDLQGAKVELTIDGTTGAVEHAEMDAD
jgi:hypothetical protein